MRNTAAIILATLGVLALPGCIAKTLVDAATAPVRVAGKAVDLATTSQSESDEKRGRALRLSEQRLGRLERSYLQHSRQCSGGQGDACSRASDEYADLQRLSPTPLAESD